MRVLWLFASAAAALAGCTSSPEPAPAPAPTAVTAPAPAPPPTGPTEASLYGRWQILALNGRPPTGGSRDPAAERTPHISFAPGGYGGNAGCNSFGGYGLFDGRRYYASRVTMTAIGCSDLAAQEDAVVRLMTASPRIAQAADGSLNVTAGTANMVLRRSATPLQRDQRTEVLAGTSWVLDSVDGESLSAQDFRPPELRIEADQWMLTDACGLTGGTSRQIRDSIMAETPPAGTRACPPGAAVIEARLFALLAASPRFVTGPNGEILIGGGDHWVTGQRPRMPLADDAPFLAGTWRIVAIDGATPAGEPRIAFGPSGFSGGTGCNSMQGHYLAHGRRFFAPPPIRTEMGCAEPLRSQEERIATLLAGVPRIALAGVDDIALVDAAGNLRLRRESADAPASPAGRPWTGTPLRAELTMIGGAPFQAHYSDPVTHIRLSARRFDIESGCGRLGGVWRREEAGAYGFFSDPERNPGGTCTGGLAARFEELKRLLNGRGRILVGESGELLIAGEQSWLAGRIVAPPRR